MIKERRISPAWYIAATHYLIAGFLAPLVIGFTVGTAVVFAFESDALITEVLFVVLGVIAVWLGVIYSARFLEKTYIIPEPKKVITLATTYFAVLSAFFIAAAFFVAPDREVDTGVFAVLSTLGALVEIVVFYVTSKKFIKATTVD